MPRPPGARTLPSADKSADKPPRCRPFAALPGAAPANNAV